MNLPPMGSSESIDWFRKMIHAYENILTSDEKADLEKWESETLDGISVSTSDWPGWKKHIGVPPWKWRAN